MRLSAFGCWLSALGSYPTNHEPRARNHEPRTTSYEPRTTSYELPRRRPRPCGRPRAAGLVDRVEEELEGAVWLGAEGDLRPEREGASTADGRFERRDTTLEIVLAPRPAAPQRRRAVEPHDRPDSARERVGRQPEDRAVVEEDVDLRLGAGGRWRRRIDRHPHDGARDVELVAAQWAFRLPGQTLDHVVGDRQLQRLRECFGCRAGRHHHAAALDELADVGFRGRTRPGTAGHLAQ